MKYNLDMTLKQLGEDKGATAIFDRFVPGVRLQMGQNPMAAKFSLRKLLSWLGDRFPQEAAQALDRALIEYGKTADYTPAEKAKMAAYQKIAEEDRRHWADKALLPEHRQDAIYPGRQVLAPSRADSAGGRGRGSSPL